MADLTARLWDLQNRHQGDRQQLFAVVDDAIEATKVLYPGSFVDVAASFVFDDVTYVDMDKRAAQFFADSAGVRDLIAANTTNTPESDGALERRFDFVAADYRDPLGLEDESFDLLVSLYAGFVSEACTNYLKVGGSLLVNPSHGDASMASIDDRYQLTAVILSRSGRYRVSRVGLDSYLVPKRDQEVTPDLLHELGRGIAYTKTPFAYLFERVR